MTPSSGSIRVAHRTRENSYVYQLIIKEYDKGYRIIPRWKRRIGQGIWEGAQSSDAFSGRITLPNTCTCSPAWKLSENCTFGIFTEVSSHRHKRSLTPFFSPSSQEKGQGRAENFRLLIMAWSFRWPALIQELTQSHLIKTKDTSITQGITRVSGDLCQELGAKTKYIFLLPHKMTLSQQLTNAAPFQYFKKSAVVSSWCAALPFLSPQSQAQ